MLENSVNSWDTKVFLAGETCKWPLKKKKVGRREIESNFMVLFLCLGNAIEVLCLCVNFDFELMVNFRLRSI